MKINKLLLALFIVVATMFVACEEYVDTEVQSPTVSQDNPGVRFAALNKTQYELELTVNAIELMVIRNGSESAIEVPIKVLENTANSFDVPASVSFPAGQDTVMLALPINHDNAPLGEPIIITITFEDSNPYLVEYSTFYGQVAILDWQPYAIGTYTSQFFEEGWEQVLFRALNTDKYRFFDLYFPGFHFNFTWVEGEQSLIPIGDLDADGYYIFMPGYVHPSYGDVTVRIDANKTYTFYDAENELFQFEGKWTVDAGSFGWFDEIYTISEKY